MIPLKYLILILFSSIGFLLTVLNRDKLAVGVMVFFIPFAAHPLADSNFPILLGLNAFLVWSIWLGMKTRTLLTRIGYVSWTHISGKLRYFYYFLLAGFLIPLAKNDYSDINLGSLSPLESVVNYSLSIFTLILFIKIMVNYGYDFEFQDKLKLVFASTCFLQFASFVFYYGGYGNLVPRFLLGTDALAGSYLRFGALLGDYELIADYSLVVIGLAIILYVKRRWTAVAATACLVSMAIGILSGTRSFIVVLLIFILLVGLLYVARLRLYHSLFKFTIVGALIVIAGLYAVDNFTPAEAILVRAVQSIEYLKEGDIQAATNRNLLAALPDLVKTSGFLGMGAVTIYQIGNNGMVYHNLYYAIYANFG